MLKATEILASDWLRANLSVKIPDKIFSDFHQQMLKATEILASDWLRANYVSENHRQNAS